MVKQQINIKNFWYSPLLTGAVLLGIFLLSLLLFIINGGTTRRVILFFPRDNWTDLSGDFHIIPIRKSQEESMEILMAEAILEPFDFRLNKSVPEGVKINSLIYNRETRDVYIDFSVEMAAEDPDSPRLLDSQKMLDILEKNLRFSYRKLNNVLFTIDGQAPFSPYFYEREE